jgi:hypothetical protein
VRYPPIAARIAGVLLALGVGPLRAPVQRELRGGIALALVAIQVVLAWSVARKGTLQRMALSVLLTIAAIVVAGFAIDMITTSWGSYVAGREVWFWAYAVYAIVYWVTPWKRFAGERGT